MRLYEFGDNLFLEYNTAWFLWEPSWETFRPITAVQWDGYTFVIDDRAYCSDPTDEFYGFGSQQMKDACEKLNELPSRDTICHFDTPEIGPLTWFRDRYVSLLPCTPKDTASWKRMHSGKPRTCRRPPKGKRITRRNRSFRDEDPVTHT